MSTCSLITLVKHDAVHKSTPEKHKRYGIDAETTGENTHRGLQHMTRVNFLKNVPYGSSHTSVEKIFKLSA